MDLDRHSTDGETVFGGAAEKMVADVSVGELMGAAT